MSSSFCLHACLFSWYTSHGGMLNCPLDLFPQDERERERTVTFKLEITSVVSAQSLVLFAGDHLVVY
jgi:hypothetical protein